MGTRDVSRRPSCDGVRKLASLAFATKLRLGRAIELTPISSITGSRTVINRRLRSEHGRLNPHLPLRGV